MTAKRTYLYVSWQEYGQAVEAAIRVAKERGWDKKFSRIYGVPLGGLPLAVQLAYEFKWKLYLPPNGVFPAYVGGQFVPFYDDLLIVDEIADTGKTLKRFQEAGYDILTIFKHPKSIVTPNIWVHEKPVGNFYLVFPYAANDLPEDDPRLKIDCPT